MRQTRTLWRIHALMLLKEGLIATSFIVSKAIAGGLDPAILTLIRFVLAALLFLPFVCWKYGLHLPSKKQLFGYACISLTLTGYIWLTFISLRSTTALNAGVLFTLVPGSSGLCSAILLKERLGKRRFMAMLPAAAGAVWVLFRGSMAQLLAFSLNPGDLLYLAACLLMAWYAPFVRLFHRQEPVPVMTFWVLLTGCCWLLLVAAPRLPEMPCWRSIAAPIWAGIAYLAVFTTIITFFLSQLCTLHLGPTRVMAYSYLYPPFILGIEWLCGQPLPPAQVLPGIGLIAAAMLIVQQGADSAEPACGRAVR